jgi:hypothetical protein
MGMEFLDSPVLLEVAAPTASRVLEERDSCFRASSGKVVLAWPVHLVGLFRQPCSKTRYTQFQNWLGSGDIHG